MSGLIGHQTYLYLLKWQCLLILCLRSCIKIGFNEISKLVGEANMDKEQYLEELMAEIKEKYSSSILESQVNIYLEQYQQFYRETISPNPAQGFTANMGWHLQRKSEFDDEFKNLGIRVNEDPVEKLHDYENQLKQTGMSRLSELEKKLDK